MDRKDVMTEQITETNNILEKIRIRKRKMLLRMFIQRIIW